MYIASALFQQGMAISNGQNQHKGNFSSTERTCRVHSRVGTNQGNTAVSHCVGLIFVFDSGVMLL